MAAQKDGLSPNAGVSFSLEEFIPFRIVSLGHAFSRRLADAYDDEGVTIPEWRVLAVIAEHRRIAARDVVARTPMDKMSVSRAVSGLEHKQLVERAPEETDRRVAMLTLTSHGRSIFRRIAKIALDYEARILSELTVSERKALCTSLSKLEVGANNL
ncbi:MAG: MarR family transcriptional regulator [Pseudomonadota bacterium]